MIVENSHSRFCNYFLILLLLSSFRREGGGEAVTLIKLFVLFQFLAEMETLSTVKGIVTVSFYPNLMFFFILFPCMSSQ